MNYNNNFIRLSVLLASTLALSACGGGGGGGTPAQPAAPTTVSRQAIMTTGQETTAPLAEPHAATPGGNAKFELYSTNRLRGSMTLTGFATPADVTAAHLHDGDAGANGNIVVHLTSTDNITWTVLPAEKILSDSVVARFKAGGLYANAHTATNGAGVVRGQLISFNDNIQTIFNASCAVSPCHVAGGQAPMSLATGASIGNLVNVTSTFSTPQGPRVSKFDSANSVLYKRVSGTTSGPQMPLNGTPISTVNQNLIKVWIDMGAAND